MIERSWTFCISVSHFQHWARGCVEGWVDENMMRKKCLWLSTWWDLTPYCRSKLSSDCRWGIRGWSKRECSVDFLPFWVLRYRATCITQIHLVWLKRTMVGQHQTHGSCYLHSKYTKSAVQIVDKGFPLQRFTWEDVWMLNVRFQRPKVAMMDAGLVQLKTYITLILEKMTLHYEW